MKKSLIALAMLALMSVPAFAATTATIPVTASVASVLDMTVSLHERAAGSDLPLVPTVATMAFGQLTNNTFGALVGTKNYAVYISANTSSLKYQIASSMSALTNGTTTLPNAMGMTVVSAKDGANADISGDTLITTRSAIMTALPIYTSNLAGTGATLELWYGIAGFGVGGALPFTGFVPVLLDQATGAYTASINYTLTLI